MEKLAVGWTIARISIQKTGWCTLLLWFLSFSYLSSITSVRADAATSYWYSASSCKWQQSANYQHLSVRSAAVQLFTNLSIFNFSHEPSISLGIWSLLHEIATAWPWHVLTTECIHQCCKHHHGHHSDFFLSPRSVHSALSRYNVLVLAVKGQ